MSDLDRTTENRDHGADVAAYALGAMEPAEAEAFGHHLETCVSCRDELAAFQRVVETLSLSAPAHPAPASLRRRVLHEVAQQPIAGEDRRPARRSPAAARWRWPRLLTGVAGAVAVAAVVFAIVSLTSSSVGRTRIIEAKVTGPGFVHLQVNRDRGTLIVRGFASPPKGKIYEVWTERGKAPPVPTTALFDVTHNGDGDVEVPGSLRGVSAVLVTPEPAGGSQKPTHSPVIVAPLT